ncbi:MAG: cytochrome ubiquinol oxidase subunit I [Candidatus Paraprevotella stercoravium]|uniref:Cytochrome ubiquinol oxidase subunit I n=2 Tax=Bacteroidales TaxID=171549 RepID=A0ABT7U5K9_9BACE|nr:cytochrome ubiquinol oxidase subunit I [Candidatus Paraprevotella stercoravium]MDM8145809.1 cytochrome ubiquinol oxidase subunit I [Bacteroides eggerthii]
MTGTVDLALIDWSRAQFALTAIYHWLFVPLTLGLAVIMGVMETLYYKSGNEFWKRTARFWMKLFGINFAIGVATGLILEFEFGTNWSNYSWFVGDIFGAPLAIEGILAFFMESTFIAVMFFGWNKVSKGFHLASTWLTGLGATISAWWILVANAWMQYPVGMEFNPDTVRNEMVDFWAVATSPVAVNKFFHTVLSSWVLGAAFVVGVSAWFLWKRREKQFALASMKVAACTGLVAAVMTAWTGDQSGYHVAQHQPMKLAAMEALYEGQKGASLVAVGILNRTESGEIDPKNPLIAEIKIPNMLSVLAYRDKNSYVPGINNLLHGGYTLPDGSVALSAQEKMNRGKMAIAALGAYRQAKNNQDTSRAEQELKTLRENMPYFGYGYIREPGDLVPNVTLNFYAFRVMVGLGGYLILFFVVILFLAYRKQLAEMRWMQWLAMLTVPLAYLASQAGWIVAECGRQPWAIQDLLPVNAAISSLETSSVQTTFFIFLFLFTLLLIVEIRIMLKAIVAGPEQDVKLTK